MSDEGRVRRALAGDTSLLAMRAFPLRDIEILSRAKGGDGRTVTAYAAVFNKPTEIVDQDGHYNEQIAPVAFNKSLADRSRKIGVYYNHGKTLHGTPSERGSVPLGSPLEPPRPDGNGLLTVSRYNRTQLADDVLEAIKNGDITGQSFTGVFLHSDPDNGPYYGRSGQLTTVTRREIALVEYGPTPIPAYEAAEIVGVRNREGRMSGDHDHTHDRASGPEPYERHPGEDVQCPACGKFNDDDAVYCDQCGKKIPDSAFPAGPQPYHRDAGETVQCPNCMKFDMPDARFCDQCGEQLPDSAYNSGGAAAPGNADRAAARAPGDAGDGEAAAPEDERTRANTMLCEHFGWEPGGADALGDSERSLLLASISEAHGGGEHERASVDDSAWDGNAAMGTCSSASDYRAICAGEKTIGDPSERQHWALPHHKQPGAAPNAGGVRNSLSRLPQTQDLKNKSAAEAHLRAHMRAIAPDSGDSGSSNSSGRSEPAGPAAVNGTGAGTGTPLPPPAEPPTHSVNRSTSNASTGEGTMTEQAMTVEERAARQDEIRARLAEIDSQYTGAALPEKARSEWKQLQDELVINEDAIRDATERATYLRTIAAQNPEATVQGADPGSGYADAQEAQRSGAVPQQSRSGTPRAMYGAPYLSRRPHNIYDVAGMRREARSIEDLPGLYRDRAKWSLEEATFPGDGRPREVVQERVQHLLDTRDDVNGTLARNMLLTGSPEYRRAFGKLLARMNVGALDQAEQRALAMGTPASWQPGSFPVPYQLDPTVTLTSNGAINALRQIARVEQIVGKEWLGVTSSGITVTRANEVTAATDATASPFAMNQPGVAPTRVQAFVPFSVEVEQDWNGLMAEIAMMLADAKDVEEAATFLTGAGTGNIPQGVLTGVTAGGTAQQITTAGTAAVSPGDVYALESAMAPRFRAQASLLASKGGYNAIRATFQAFASAAGDVWVRPSAGTAPELLGYPAYENSNMASTTATGNQVLLMGDFKQFIVVDRIGMSVELIPHVFASGGLPQGQRGIYALWRNSSQVLVPNAFRFLQAR
jgi:HK97 family phage major capsid protein/HK97 family phage prohead protease